MNMWCPSESFFMNRQRMVLLGLKHSSNRNSCKSKNQYLLLRVIPYMDFPNLTGLPQYSLYSGNRIPKIGGIGTKILLLVCACKKAPTKSSCLTRALTRVVWARNIFNAQNEAVGDHLSPWTTKWVLSLSREPPLLILTFNTSMTGITLSPLFDVSWMNVLLSTRVLSSFLTDLNHSDIMCPSGIFMMSLMVLGAGSQDWKVEEGDRWMGRASMAQASCKSASLHRFSHDTVLAAEAYLGFGLGMREDIWFWIGVDWTD